MLHQCVADIHWAIYKWLISLSVTSRCLISVICRAAARHRQDRHCHLWSRRWFNEWMVHAVKNVIRWYSAKPFSLWYHQLDIIGRHQSPMTGTETFTSRNDVDIETPSEGASTVGIKCYRCITRQLLRHPQLRKMNKIYGCHTPVNTRVTIINFQHQSTISNNLPNIAIFTILTPSAMFGFAASYQHQVSLSLSTTPLLRLLSCLLP